MFTLNRLATTKLLKKDGGFVAKFQAMGCSCEILMDTEDEILAQELFDLALNETRRIERKWSRYVKGNIIHSINTSEGRAIAVDEETARLLHFADRGYQLSEGLFDITSGVLRNVWTFDGSNRHPTHEAVAKILPLVGWDKVKWDGNQIQLRTGMEIDLGGIGKEYAVDRVANLLKNYCKSSVLVNFGGDVAVLVPRRDGRAWTVGIENIQHENQPARIIHLTEGALATSGDSKRFVIINGKRLGHILNPRTGWPVEGSPRSVTVAAPTCSEAGFLSTLAILNGHNAESILENAHVRHWCY